MLKLGATIFHRITGKEYKIEGFFFLRGYINPKEIPLTQGEALSLAKEDSHKIFVEFKGREYDTWANVNSNLYMSEQEYKAMTRFVAGVDPYCDNPTIIIFDKQTRRVYREKDFVPNPK